MLHPRGYTSRKGGNGPGQVSPLVPFNPEPGPMGALDPVREPRGPAGPRGPLVPVHLDLLVPVGGMNRDQRASLLAHHHWSRLVA